MILVLLICSQVDGRRQPAHPPRHPGIRRVALARVDVGADPIAGSDGLEANGHDLVWLLIIGCGGERHPAPHGRKLTA